MPAQKDKSMANTKNFSIWPEIPEDALLTRQQVVAILHISMSTLDSLIPNAELPRVRLSKTVFVPKTKETVRCHLALCRDLTNPPFGG
jgi:hypothetical protein